MELKSIDRHRFADGLLEAKCPSPLATQEERGVPLI